MTASRTLVITGAAGRLGTYLRSSLNEVATRARLVDIVAPPEALPGEPVEIYQGSVTDPDLLDAVCRGADAVVHLGGFAGDASWPDLSEVNVGGTREVLEAARRNGVKRVVVASSNHAVGFQVRGPSRSPTMWHRMPDSLYGVSKAAVEALCQFYSVKFSMDIVCLRIGSCFDVSAEPPHAFHLALAGRFRAADNRIADDPAPAFRLVWGVSANTRRWWSTAGGEAIGFHPEDNAERFAELYPGRPPEPEYVGGATI